MALRAVALAYTNAHPQGPTGATLSIRVAFFEDGFGDLADLDVDVDFSTPAAIPSLITTAIVNWASSHYGKAIVAANIFLPSYAKGQ